MQHIPIAVQTLSRIPMKQRDNWLKVKFADIQDGADDYAVIHFPRKRQLIVKILHEEVYPIKQKSKIHSIKFKNEKNSL